ncbi:hypothetical protein BVRB_5g110830 [Beta vulgaris subsp. vulgaris]|nr:hypothetical protein BVRB_5g110830 [Beta vulgaris subsp. vulgaris]
MMYPSNNYGSLEHTYFYGGYDGGASSWNAYPRMLVLKAYTFKPR